jgi:hypothetical protein
MKNATATSHGTSRKLEALGGAEDGSGADSAAVMGSDELMIEDALGRERRIPV